MRWGTNTVRTIRSASERKNQTARTAGSLGTLGALADLELHTLVLLEGTEAVALNFGVVNEDVCGTVFGSDEARSPFQR